MLGCGACMGALRRIQSGAFSLSDAVSLNALEAMTYEEQRALLMPVEALFSDLPVLSPEPFFLRLAKSGAELYQHKIGCAYAVGQRIRLYDENGFFALGEVREYPDGTAVKPIKFFRL